MKHYQRLEGMVAATFTPMDARGDINLSVIDKYADLMAESGMAGVFVCGTTGESHSLTTGERKAILAQWIKSARKRFKVIAHVGSNCQLEAMELARHAQEVEADAFAAMAPCFFKPSSVKDLVDFFTPIAGLALGAVAGVGSTYNYLPAVYQNLFDAFKKGDICTARRMQQKSIEIVKIIIKYGGGVRGGKAIMNLIGVDCGRCRLPVTPFGDDEYSSLKRDLEKIGFLN